MNGHTHTRFHEVADEIEGPGEMPPRFRLVDPDDRWPSYLERLEDLPPHLLRPIDADDVLAELAGERAERKMEQVRTWLMARLQEGSTWAALAFLMLFGPEQLDLADGMTKTAFEGAGWVGVLLAAILRDKGAPSE